MQTTETCETTKAFHGGGTFVLLQVAHLLEDRLQVHVEAVAVAEQLQQVAGAHRAARVVDQLPGAGQPVGQDLKLLALEYKHVYSTFKNEFTQRFDRRVTQYNDRNQDRKAKQKQDQIMVKLRNKTIKKQFIKKKQLTHCC